MAEASSSASTRPLDASGGASTRSSPPGGTRRWHAAAGRGRPRPSTPNGDVYWGTANPYPWGGTPQRPNGGDYPGDVKHTDSLVVLSGRTGSLRWADQVTPHDIRDYDFQLPPILALVGGRAVVVGGGKAGRVIAWDRTTHRRLWETKVGLRRNDVGPLPASPVSVCPGLLGGVETPMALSGERVFVPVVDLCFRQSSHGPEGLDFFRVDYSKGKGELVALDARSGRRLWTRKLPSPNFGCATVANDVVFTATYDGTIYGLSVEDGRTLWKAGRVPASTPAPLSRAARCSSWPAPTTRASSRPCSSSRRSGCRTDSSAPGSSG